jgi:peptide deformylase
MTLLRIVRYPDPVLRGVASPVEAFDERLKTLVGDMAETMYYNDGIGLAAPQVGVSQRVIVLDRQDVIADSDAAKPRVGVSHPSTLVALVNPVVEARVDSLEQTEVGEEGCLSLPGAFVKVRRPIHATVAYRELDGGEAKQEFVGREARVVLHEIDHLDGVLISDYMSAFEKRVLLRRR